MYPEISHRSASQDGSLDEIQRTYQTFARSMRFDLYTREFAGRVEAILKQMDSDFLLKDVAS